MSQLPHTYPARAPAPSEAPQAPAVPVGNDPTAWASGVELSDYFEETLAAYAVNIEEPIKDDSPLTLAEAQASMYWLHWKKALEQERSSLEKRGVWEVVEEIPAGAKILQAKNVYKQKRDQFGNVNRFKCRVTAKGYSQVELVHYYDTFAAVASGSYVRTVLAMAVGKGYKLEHLDVTTAFLYGELKEELYMVLPEDIAKFPGESVKLKHSIYGTKQAAHNWWKLLTETLLGAGLKPAVDEETIFVQNSDDGYSKVIVITFVDDIIVCHNNDKYFHRFIKHLKGKFDITLEGELSWYLGVRYQRDGRTLLATQESYIDRLCTTFGGDKWHAVKTPMEEGFTVHVDDCDATPPLELVGKYRKLLGSLLFIACWTRPDISLAVTKLARYSTCATPKLYAALKRVLRYVIGTKHLGITWTGNEDDLKRTGHKLGELYAYVDAAYADDPITRRSTMGYTIMLNGGVVSWRSKRQPIVALSTAESEYVAACYAAQEVVSLRMLLKRLGFVQDAPTCVYEDNAACILLSGEPVFRERSKHIDVRWHFVRNMVRAQQLQLVPCSTHAMIADAMTKPLGWVKHLRFTEQIMNYKFKATPAWLRSAKVRDLQIG